MLIAINLNTTINVPILGQQLLSNKNHHSTRLLQPAVKEVFELDTK